MTSVPRTRSGFTLIELLIVVSIISVLAGLLLPAIGLVRKHVKNVQCSNNLRELALIIHGHRLDHEDKPPASLIGLLGTSDYDLTLKGLRCPFDLNAGSDVEMGRRRHNPLDTRPWDSYSYLHEPGSSYCYESSSDPTRFTIRDAQYFYRYTATVPLNPTWGQAKLDFQQSGNLLPGKIGPITLTTPTNWFGQPFPSNLVPIVRCYWHENWNSLTDLECMRRRKVNNVMLGFNIDSSWPYWEVEYNRNIDPSY